MYKYPKSVMQYKDLSGFFNTLKQVLKISNDHKKDTLSNYKKNNPSDYENNILSNNVVFNNLATPTFNNHQKMALVTGNFVLASTYVQRTNSQILLVNAFDNLKVSPNKLSYILAKYNINILEKDTQKVKIKDIKKDRQKRKG
ncbi:3891_t:CDS:2 [Cetraspora pellucida]|uniref:3891_t:CDS:1 n=1 Tax=Cetraspora pellucida TaxID=1433469 RepID=A0A9N9G1F7_9GLOM|nr:3891_t:CDS:2 [Cetraspora pellucida]